MTPTQRNETLDAAATGNLSAASALLSELWRIASNANRDVPDPGWESDTRPFIDRCRNSDNLAVRAAAVSALSAEFDRRARAADAARFSPRWPIG